MAPLLDLAPPRLHPDRLPAGREIIADLAASWLAVAAIILVRVAMRLERRFRSAQPAARATQPAVHRTPVWHPGHSPVTRIAGIAIIIGAIAALTTLAVQLH
jgi:hypothetical protein